MIRKDNKQPRCERDFDRRFSAGTDIGEGLSGRVTVTQDNPYHRVCRKNGGVDIERQYPGMSSEMALFMGDSND